MSYKQNVRVLRSSEGRGEAHKPGTQESKVTEVEEILKFYV